MSDPKDGPNGPVEVELKVHITNGERSGVATIGMGFGSFPTPKRIAERLEKFEKEELAKAAPGYRMMTAPEFWDAACMEKTGQTFATPADWQEFKPVA